MGKRSSFKRKPRDFYKTPLKAVLPLFKFLRPGRYTEPCAGNGALIAHLSQRGLKCGFACDIRPMKRGIKRRDALTLKLRKPRLIITNPPWDRDILHKMIIRFSDMAPTWLLLDADWAHTQQAAPYMRRCKKIVAVGRVRWIEKSKHDGKENCAWYLFDRRNKKPAIFIPRRL